MVVSQFFLTVLLQAHKSRKKESFFIFREKSQNHSLNLKELSPSPSSSSVQLSPDRRERSRNALDSAVWGEQVLPAPPLNREATVISQPSCCSAHPKC